MNKPLAFLLAVIIATGPMMNPAIGPAPAWACAWEPPSSEYYSRFFRPDLFRVEGRSFFYPDQQYKYWEDKDRESENREDWKAQVPGSTDSDVEAFVYASDHDFLKKLREALEGDSLEQLAVTEKEQSLLTENAFLRHIVTAKDMAMLDYMIFVHESAPILVEKKDRWEYSAPDDARTIRHIVTASERMRGASSPFLRLRYTYQAIRLNLLRQAYEESVSLYEKNIGDLDAASPVREWCRSFYAGALYRLGRREEAAGHFALVFQRSSRYRQAGFVGCRWVEDYDRNLKRSLAVAEDPDMVAALKTFAAYFETSEGKAVPDDDSTYFSMLRDLRDRRTVTPDIYILTSRVINRLEVNFLGLKEHFFIDMLSGLQVAPLPDELEKTHASLEVLDNLVMEVRDSVAAGAGVPGFTRDRQRAYWALVSSYLALLRGDEAQYRSRMDWAKSRYLNDEETNQAYVLDLLADVLTSFSSPEKRQKLEAELPGRLARLLPELPLSQDTNFEGEAEWKDRAAAHLLANILPRLYEMSGRPELAAMSTSLTGEVTRTFSLQNSWGYRWWRGFEPMSALDLDALTRLEIMFEKPANAFEAFLAEPSPDWTRKYIPDFRAIQYLKEHRFSDAASALEMGENPANALREDGEMFHESPRAWSRKVDDDAIPPRPALLTAGEVAGALKNAESSIRDSALADIALFDSPATDRRDFAVRMDALGRLTNVLGESEAGAKAAWMYANGFFSMGYQGRAWWLTAWHRSPYETWERWGRPDSTKKPADDYYRADTAREWYLEAARRSSDPELRARALYMAAFCTQGYTQMYSYSRNDEPKEIPPYIQPNNYFQELMDSYSDTEFFRAALKACSFLRDFEKLNRR